MVTRSNNPPDNDRPTGNGGSAWFAWTSTSSTSADITWSNWTSGTTASATDGIYSYRQRELTAEEQQQIEENRIRYQEETKRKEEAKVKAEKVAEELLIDHLSGLQKSDWKKNKYFSVVSPKGRNLRLLPRRTSNIEEFDSQNKRIGVYCIHPDFEIPINDQLLMQKMMIEHHEEEFFKIAIKRG